MRDSFAPSISPGALRNIVCEHFRIPIGTLRNLERRLPAPRKEGRGGAKRNLKEAVDVVLACGSGGAPVTIDKDVREVRDLVLNPAASRVIHLPGYSFSKQVRVGRALECLIQDIAANILNKGTALLVWKVNFLRGSSGPLVEIAAGLGGEDRAIELCFGEGDFSHEVVRSIEVRGGRLWMNLAQALYQITPDDFQAFYQNEIDRIKSAASKESAEVGP